MIESDATKGIDMSKRIAQLERTMNAGDVGELLEHRTTVQEYRRLGDHWRAQGCFRIAEKSTRDTGREIMTHNLNPEGYLAVLVDEAMQGQQNAAVFEREMDAALAKDPKALARGFLEEALLLDQQHSVKYQKARRISDEYRGDFEKEPDPVKAFAILGVLPVAERMKPSWFQVIDHHQLSPTDLEAFYETYHSDNWKGSKPLEINRDQGMTGSKVYQTLGS